MLERTFCPPANTKIPLTENKRQGNKFNDPGAVFQEMPKTSGDRSGHNGQGYIYPPKPWDGVNFSRAVIAKRQSIAPMASEIFSGRDELLKKRGSQYVAKSFFNILSSSRSASSICHDFRDPFATLLTNEGLTFNLLAILAYTPAKANMIFPGVRPAVPG
jgi:hypothetical protein